MLAKKMKGDLSGSTAVYVYDAQLNSSVLNLMFEASKIALCQHVRLFSHYSAIIRIYISK